MLRALPMPTSPGCSRSSPIPRSSAGTPAPPRPMRSAPGRSAATTGRTATTPPGHRYPDGTLLGSVSLYEIDPDQRKAEIGYQTAPWARGRGVAAAAVRIVVRAASTPSACTGSRCITPSRTKRRAGSRSAPAFSSRGRCGRVTGTATARITTSTYTVCWLLTSNPRMFTGSRPFARSGDNNRSVFLVIYLMCRPQRFRQRYIRLGGSNVCRGATGFSDPIRKNAGRSLQVMRQR